MRVCTIERRLVPICETVSNLGVNRLIQYRKLMALKMSKFIMFSQLFNKLTTPDFPIHFRATGNGLIHRSYAPLVTNIHSLPSDTLDCY